MTAPTAFPDRLAIVERARDEYEAARSEAVRTECVPVELHDLRAELDDAVRCLVTDWELIGAPDEYRPALENLPGFDRWRIEAFVDPASTAAFDEIVATDAATTSDHPRVSRGGAFVYDAPDRPPSIWGTDDTILWAQGEPLLLAGPTGVGKSTLAAQLVAGRLGILDQVLDHRIAPGDRPVLYLAMDRPTQLRRLLHRLFAAYDARSTLDDRLLVWSGPLSATLNARPGVLVELAQDLGAGTVVVDSLKDAAVKLTDDESGGNINRAFQEVSAEGIDLLVLHHQRKATSDSTRPPKALDDVYGSALIPAGMGSVLSLWGKAGDPIVELHHLKQPLEQMPTTRIEHDNQTGLSRVVAGFDPLVYLTNRGRHGATARDAAQQMFAKADPSANEVAKAKRALDQLHRRLPDQVHRSTPGTGGDGGQEAVRWTFTGGSDAELGAAAQPATRGSER